MPAVQPYARIRNRSRRIALCTLFLLVCALLAACSLAEDVTPPPGFVTAAPPATSAPSFPKTKPSIARGAAVYAQNCTRCHGATGNADGEMVSKITVPVPAFTNPDFAFNTTPQRWFGIITAGNLDRFMPPWGDTLSESDRWHVIAYLYSLSATTGTVKTGQGLYEADCLQCHGPAGAGDGPQAQGSLPDFTGQAYMAARSDKEFFEALAKPHHDFSGKLSEQERRAVVGYVRALSLDTGPPKQQKGTVTGRITNGTASSTLPANQTVTLRIFDNFQEIPSLTATAGADGAFEFQNLDLPDGRAFIVTTRYDDVLYTSDVAPAAADTFTYDLPVTVYETTTDPASVAIDRLHIVLDFQPGIVQVGELLAVNNSSDRAYIGPQPGGATLQVALPAGYTDLSFQDGQVGDRYRETAGGFADTLPVAPGTGTRQILLAFKLQYTNSFSFTQTLAYPINTVNLLVPDVGVTVSGPGLVDGGLTDMQGGKFHNYNLASLKPDTPVAFSLSGQPAAAASSTTTGSGAPAAAFNWRDVLIGVLALALAGSVLAYWWTGRVEGRAQAPAEAAPIEDRLAALAELDDDFEAGRIAEASYRARRQTLKAELKRLMDMNSGND